jgi:undecaprenyl-diphosphatase
VFSTAALLGLVQGLTEFLPVSSSAHLILARLFFGWEAPEFGLAFDVALHVGTLAAIVTYFWTDIVQMVLVLPSALSAGGGARARLIRMIVIATVPAIVAALVFNDYVERVLRTPFVAATALALGGIVMLVAERVHVPARDEFSVTAADAVAIGVAQATALIPGVSRSGSTIAIGMLLGLSREAAARFTFLLAIPAILAAAGKESLDLVRMEVGGGLLLLFAVGALVSAVVGYLTVKYFLRFLARHRLDVFAWYRLALAAFTFAWLAR